MRVLGLVLLCAAAAFAQEDPASRPVAQDDPAVVEVRGKLARDPDYLDAAAERLTRSRISPYLDSSRDFAARRENIKAWMLQDTDSAARLVLGLQRDDREGDHGFENGVVEAARTYFVENPGAQRNTYFRLKRAVAATRDIFDARVRGVEIHEKRPQTAEPDAYDRLSSVNPLGYSPQVLTLQSEFNIHRPPNAPPLNATGRLDYETLFYPAYGMRWDLQNLEKRKVARAAEALAKARQALADFEAAAANAQAPDRITRDLILGLGRRRTEAARWIAAASLEEQIANVEAQEAFLASRSLPERFQKAAGDLLRRAEKIKALSSRALVLLEGANWPQSLAEAGGLLAQSLSLWRRLEPEIENLRRAASRQLAPGAS